ncbi:MAG: DUF1634 domain-containing protein [Chloroflexota bacterium]
MTEKTNKIAQTDEPTYRWTSLILRIGMYISFSVMMAGVIWSLVIGLPASTATSSNVVPLDQILPEIAAGNPLALLNLGVVLLLATPAATLLGIIITYALERNTRYTAIAALIGVVLLLSLAISLRWIVLF